MCVEHLLRSRAWFAEARAEARAAGYCYDCMKAPAGAGVRCTACVARRKASP